MTYFKYGNTKLPQNELNLVHLDSRTTLSPRGKSKEKVVTWYLIGEVFDTGSSLVSTMNSRSNTFSQDYQTATFLLDDGTTQANLLDNNSSISGVHVIRLSLPKNAPEELATQRTYGVTLQATYPSVETELMYYQERLQFIGTTTPEVVWTYLGPISTGIPSVQTMIQTGYALTYSTYFTPPGPYYPAFEDQRQRFVEPISGKQRGQGFSDFGMVWRYVMRSTAALDTYPISR